MEVWWEPPPLHPDISIKAQISATLPDNSIHYFEDEGMSRNVRLGPSNHNSPYSNGKKICVRFWQLLNVFIASTASETATGWARGLTEPSVKQTHAVTLSPATLNSFLVKRPWW